MSPTCWWRTPKRAQKQKPGTTISTRPMRALSQPASRRPISATMQAPACNQQQPAVRAPLPLQRRQRAGPYEANPSVVFVVWTGGVCDGTGPDRGGKGNLTGQGHQCGETGSDQPGHQQFETGQCEGCGGSGGAGQASRRGGEGGGETRRCRSPAQRQTGCGRGSRQSGGNFRQTGCGRGSRQSGGNFRQTVACQGLNPGVGRDRKSTRLNSSHGYISYAVFCLKKKKKLKTLLTKKKKKQHNNKK